MLDVGHGQGAHLRGQRRPARVGVSLPQLQAGRARAATTQDRADAHPCLADDDREMNHVLLSEPAREQRLHDVRIHRHHDIGTGAQRCPRPQGRKARRQERSQAPVLRCTGGQDRAHPGLRQPQSSLLSEGTHAVNRQDGLGQKHAAALGVDAQPVPVDAVGPAELAGRRGHQRPLTLQVLDDLTCPSHRHTAASGGPVDAGALQVARELIEQALLGQAQVTDNGAPPRTRPDLADALLAPQDGAPTSYTHRASSQVSWNPEGAPGAQRPDGRVRAGVTVARVGAEPPEAAAGLWITIPG